eukprot:gnl/MRDRNA2_/MRDRNA2_192954_c0_seq1.p1 gnl/MRDRNA2_/MRDRNA2_192954_c0~~gnl/MRDRNA2_/MRDRNA2_192954_c0_seq1.p1  ORF type:complete len:381 (-),score=69.97 gnl/MRDRNA2_/MRDRNA2_192954_c0_seq1:41-1063(-)
MELRTLKLVDFGCCAYVESQDSAKQSDIAGTVGYCAPEVFAGKETAKSDVFSAGVILTMMLTANWPEPFSCERWLDLQGEEACKEYSSVLSRLDDSDISCWAASEGLSTGAVIVLTQLLCPDPALRLSAQEALSNRWFDASALSESCDPQFRGLLTVGEAADRQRVAEISHSPARRPSISSELSRGGSSSSLTSVSSQRRGSKTMSRLRRNSAAGARPAPGEPMPGLLQEPEGEPGEAVPVEPGRSRSMSGEPGPQRKPSKGSRLASFNGVEVLQVTQDSCGSNADPVKPANAAKQGKNNLLTCLPVHNMIAIILGHDYSSPKPLPNLLSVVKPPSQIKT